MVIMKRRRWLSTALKVFLFCRCRRLAPGLTTLVEAAAVLAKLKVLSSLSPATVGLERPWRSQAMHVAAGLAPSVLISRAVSLVGGAVSRRQQRQLMVGAAAKNEVSPLQAGLWTVPSPEQVCGAKDIGELMSLYSEWLLLLRARLQQLGVELPQDRFEDEGLELMRWGITFNLLQATTPRMAMEVMEVTAMRIREVVEFWGSYIFMGSEDLQEWERIAWWEGPDAQGYLWLYIDNREAVMTARTHGSNLCSNIIVSQMERGIRELLPQYPDAQQEVKCAVLTHGVALGGALRARPAYTRTSCIMNRVYPSRCACIYVIGLPPPLRWAFRAMMQLVNPTTRKKVFVLSLAEARRLLIPTAAPPPAADTSVPARKRGRRAARPPPALPLVSHAASVLAVNPAVALWRCGTLTLALSALLLSALALLYMAVLRGWLVDDVEEALTGMMPMLRQHPEDVPQLLLDSTSAIVDSLKSTLPIMSGEDLLQGGDDE